MYNSNTSGATRLSVWHHMFNVRYWLKSGYVNLHACARRGRVHVCVSVLLTLMSQAETAEVTQHLSDIQAKELGLGCGFTRRETTSGLPDCRGNSLKQGFCRKASSNSHHDKQQFSALTRKFQQSCFLTGYNCNKVHLILPYRSFSE